jgi:uncharacterized low-complexity protein
MKLSSGWCVITSTMTASWHFGTHLINKVIAIKLNDNRELIMAHSIKPIAAALGAAFLASSFAPVASAAANPFSAQQLSGGYDLANFAHHEEGEKKAEGSCGDKKGEGSCGDKKAEGSCGDKKAEGSCGDKKAEGSCGDKKAEGSCGGEKKAEGKCGEGKCGGSK